MELSLESPSATGDFLAVTVGARETIRLLVEEAREGICI